ncbi:uncharacterized protein ATC70_009697 [Mucor velutinosus]|uniref:XPG-I domain-containing protein n=1 Tax=Mucor velutinosus TaxID=708070 RepID=A0AAN7DQI7_9FUNG|nr:hypothetical protein ATC70_009697 [Mucor velutinosus]
MGIHKLWNVLSAGEKKLTLEELSHETHQKQGSGLRVAIDVALWVFQSRSSVVGDQSEIRSLFFRFNKLYELGIRPVFVFDGPSRPDYKRNRFINTRPLETTFRANLIAMIKFFHFSIWNAYGEAEAECALLQRLDFVDAVYTGDSDVFLFGARRVIRQWPTRRYEAVPVYDITWICDSTSLDRSDLILIALLLGSDYDTKGTKGIGINMAAQLAKCHFHRGLFDDIQIAGRTPLDDERVQHLFDDLTYELQHNSTKNMLRKHTGVTLDPKFPDFSIVIDFIHPLTNIEKNDPSILKAAKDLKANLDVFHEPDWQNLANFAQHTFKWPAEYLLKRFTSLLFPAFMANRMRRRTSRSPVILQSSSQSSNSSSQQQRAIDDYFRSSSRCRNVEKPSEVVRLTAVKVIPEGNLKQYRVEWDKSCWEHFITLLKPRLDSEAYNTPDYTLVLSQHTEVHSEDEQLEEDEVGSSSSQSKSSKKEPFDLVKRQWVDADDVHHKYSSLALEFQGKKRKPAAKGEGLPQLTSFLVLPPKRIRSNTSH